jgi:F-type H+-transporting ATPase subunit b
LAAWTFAGFESMNIDWFTFVAQIVNFLVLVMLLRWFLYGPIVRAMQQRESRIAAELMDAEQAQQEGQFRATEYEQKLQELEEQRETLNRNAHEQADEQRKQLMKQAREDVQRQRLEWFQVVEREREDLLAEAQHRAGHLSAEATRRTLEQLASESLEDRIFSDFTSRLSQLNDQQRAEIGSFMEDGIVFVRSAFQVPEPWRDRLRATVRDVFDYQGSIEFEVSPDLICGIELEAGGYGFGWNVKEFLQRLETEFDERLRLGKSGRRK